MEKYINTLSEDKKFFLYEDIPEKKLNAAINSYAMDAKNPLILYDDTVFGGAKEGFLLDADNFYCKTANLKSFKISLKNIEDVLFKKSILSGDIYINGNKVAECIQAKKETVSCFVELLRELVDGLKKQEMIINESPREESKVEEREIKKQERNECINSSIPEDYRKSAKLSKIFEANIEKNVKNPPIEEEVFFERILCLLDVDTEISEQILMDLIINFVENSDQVRSLILTPLAKDKVIKDVRSFVLKKCMDLSKTSPDVPGFFTGHILTYVAWDVQEENSKKVNHTLDWVVDGLKEGAADYENPACCYYLAQFIDKNPVLCEKYGLSPSDSDTYYWIAAINNHPAALSYFAEKYSELDINLSLFFHQMAAKNNSFSSYNYVGMFNFVYGKRE